MGSYSGIFAAKIKVMTTGQVIIVISLSTFTGWIISWITILLLRSSSLSSLGFKAGQLLQREFQSSKIIEEQITDPLLFEKMKPEIEKHVDLFLNEKLALVFPLLYKFMGEKTLMQFKDAFMIEIDVLFPVIIRNYMSTLKKEVRLDTIISAGINALPAAEIRGLVFQFAKKEIFYFRMLCIITGFVIGALMVLALYLAQ